MPSGQSTSPILPTYCLPAFVPTAVCAGAFNDASLVQLGVQFGLPAESLRTLVTQTSQMWCLALSGAARTAQGATRLYDTVMSPDIDARAADHLIHATSATRDLVRLSAIGYALVTHVTDCDSQALGELAAAQAGVPAQAAYGFAGLVAFVLFSALKRHELIEEGSVAHLQRAVVQPPYAVPSDAFAQALGWPDSQALTEALQNAAVLPLPAPTSMGRQAQEATSAASEPRRRDRMRRALPAVAVLIGLTALAAWVALDPGQWPPPWIRTSVLNSAHLTGVAKAPVPSVIAEPGHRGAGDASSSNTGTQSSAAQGVAAQGAVSRSAATPSAAQANTAPSNTASPTAQIPALPDAASVTPAPVATVIVHGTPEASASSGVGVPSRTAPK
jgi:hypothetical protein